MNLIKNLTFSTFALVLISCSHMRSGKYVQLNSMNDLPQLAKNFGTSVETIKKYNSSIKPGKWIFIPTKVGIMQSKKGNYSNFHYLNEGDFSWPVPKSRSISSHFGPRNRRLHAGIDIRAPKGSSIIASKSGRVIFSGWMKGYGKVIIIKHSGNFNTVYAHNSRNFKSKGDYVDRGDVIAQVGRTGRATGNHLHFEVRISDRPIDPMKYFNSNMLAKK